MSKSKGSGIPCEDVYEAVLIYLGGVYTKKVCKKWEQLTGNTKINACVLKDMVERAKAGME